jgi:cell division protein FtsB
MAKAVRKRGKVKAGFFTKLLVLILLTALAGQLYHLRSQVEDAQAQKEALSAQVAEQQQVNEQLQSGIDNGGSEEEMKRIAREQLGLVEPTEKVFYDTSN